MALHLRVYSETDDCGFDEKQEPTVRVSLSDLLPLITIAKRNNYLWLQDFLDDEVCVSPDLYEVLRAFQHVKRPA